MEYIIGILIILILLFFIEKHFIKIHSINKQIDAANKELENQYKENSLNIKSQQEKIDILTSQRDEYEKNLSLAKTQYEEYISAQKKLTQESYSHYFDNIQETYKTLDEDFDFQLEKLQEKYQNQKEEFDKEISLTKAELEKIQATHAAAIQARLKEKEIKEKKDFYCLTIDDADKADIYRLTELKKSLNKPRVLSMLIWSTWFQKPLKTLSNNILGTTVDVVGIYKITNIVTEECYIGQSRSVAKRWAEHAKCGLGIDTPANNKLYKAMQEYGLWNFSWELLEQCPPEQLNEKEKFYIELYQSYDYGYNSNIGVSKK